MTEAIVIENVSKSFGPTRALTDVSFTIERGESRALVGKNGAGKSTIMSILTGLVAPDAGSVQVPGADGRNDFGAVGCVYQRSTLVPAATAAENIALNRYPTSLSLIRWKSVRQSAIDALADWGCAHVADTPVEQLDPLERKIVEICRVLASGPRVLLLDEPTAGLDRPAVRRLFDNIAKARERGVSIIFVSHHLHEVFEVCDSVTVLRDGKVVLTDRLASLGIPDLIEAMVGESAAKAASEVRAHADASTARADERPVLSAAGINVDGRLHDVDIALRPGECVGLTGIDGAGHMQLAEVLTGQLTPSAGSVQIDGSPLRLGSIPAAIAAGVGFTPEDRHIAGYIPALSVAENSTIGIVRSFANRLRLIDFRKRDRAYQSLADEWAIKAHSSSQAVEELSGGNQQKVVLARSVAADPRVLVLINPTAGVDVEAKSSIYSTLDALKAKGQSVLVVSSDDGDLEICDRVLVMFEGEIVTELRPPFSEVNLAAAVQGEPSKISSTSSTTQGAHA